MADLASHPFAGINPPAAPLGRVRIIDEDGSASQPFAEWVARLLHFLSAPALMRRELTYDPVNLGPNAVGAINTIDVPGAQIYDEIIVTFANPLGGLLISSWVSQAGKISFQFINPTTHAVNLAPGTLRFRVRPL